MKTLDRSTCGCIDFMRVIPSFVLPILVLHNLSAQVEFVGGAVHLWNDDEDPIVFNAEGLNEVDIKMYNQSSDDDCITQTDDPYPECAAYHCSLEYNGGLPLNSVIASASSPEVWFEKLEITTLDEITLYKHLQDNEPYHKPFYCMAQYIAGDLDGNGEIEENDQDMIHKVLLQQTVTVGHYGDIVPTWNYFGHIPYTNDQDFVDALKIYEPNAEAYYELWDEFSEAFNHYDNAGLFHESYAINSFNEDEHILFFYGIKIGDLNFSYQDDDISCLVSEFPIFDELGGSENSVLVRSTPFRPNPIFGVVSKESATSVIINVTTTDLSGLLGLQLYFKLNKVITNIELVESKLPGFNSDDFYVNLTEGLLNLAWFDRDLSVNRKNNGDTLLSFRLTGNIGSADPLWLSSSENNLLINFEEQEIPVVFEIVNPQSSNDRVLVSPNPCNDFVRFQFTQFLAPGEVSITLYDISGNVVFREQGQMDRSTYIVPIDDKLKSNSMLVYQIKYGAQVFHGKFVITE